MNIVMYADKKWNDINKFLSFRLIFYWAGMKHMDKILKIGRETAEAAVLGGSVLGRGCQEEAGWIER